jgi:hypothetical protein
VRILTEKENQRVALLTRHSVDFALLEPTETGLGKSILDATAPVREFLTRASLHDYSLQRQGPQDKVVLEAKIILEDKFVTSQASLYRPVTKKGDPRIWFKGLASYCMPNDIIATAVFNNVIYVVNITRLNIEKLVKDRSNPISELLNEINYVSNIAATELLTLLRKLSKQGPIPALLSADTAVGRTLEAKLGIKINSSKKPDYKGIELKSFRDRPDSRKNLFAQVPDWSLSKFKSSRQILENFGYTRDTVFRLYCTVSTKSRNSQGLILRTSKSVNQLIENSEREDVGDFLVWTFEKLHERLLEKHSETFWIAADSIFINGHEHFVYKNAEHTKKPIVSQLYVLIEQGIITVDHLIKRKENNSVVEKGPIFKIEPNKLNLLFPPSRQYDLS